MIKILKKSNEEWFISKETREMLIERFKELKDKVILEVFTKKEKMSHIMS